VTQYVHSASSFVAVQVDSPINSGASGGPCLEEEVGEEVEAEEEEEEGAAAAGAGEKGAEGAAATTTLDKNRVVGVAFQNVPSGDSQGYIIPMPVVHRFLDEVKAHGRYRGFCSLVRLWI
jgi:S1-C subfamily serine protease